MFTNKIITLLGDMQEMVSLITKPNDISKSKNTSGFRTITIKRTMCYGTCPAYNVEINEDGEVNYYGEAFVEKTGYHRWTIQTDAIDALNDAILKYGYFTIKAKEITRDVTCSPSCITSVLMKDGAYREIENYHGNDQYPERLKRFEGKIDSIIGIRNYVGKG